MNSRVAPRAATWLLERLGSGCRFEALIGDLLEQFEEGRSRLWYWRQTIGALTTQVLEALRTHALSFVGAVLAGCVFTSLWQLGCSHAFQSVYLNLAEVKQHPWTLAALLRLAGMQLNMVCEYALYFASAWLVTRVHRVHRHAVLLAFVAALLAQHLPGIARLLFNAPADPSLAVYLATQIILALSQATCTLVAGLCAIRAKPLAELSRWTRFVAILWIAEMLVTDLLFAACRVGEFSYRRSEFYLSMYAVGAACGLYLALILWRENSTSPAASRLSQP